MTSICSVFGCKNSRRRLKKWKTEECKEHEGEIHENCPCLIPYKFFKFPKDNNMKREWISALNRKDFVPGKYSGVCSVHFLDGKPTDVNPCPQLLLGYNRKVKPGRRKVLRRPVQQLMHQKTEKTIIPKITLKDVLLDPLEDAQLCQVKQLETRDIGTQTGECPPRKVDAGTQHTDASSDEHSYSEASRMIEHSYCGSRHRCSSLQVEMSFYSSLKGNEEFKFYTGVPETVFNEITKILQPLYKRAHLCFEDQILLTMMRIKLGLLFTDLGKRFNVSTSAASAIFSKWVPLMARELGRVICWLSRDIIQATLPEAFKSKYPNTTCVVDCSEIFLQRPTLLRTKPEAHSHYIAHKTAKFLIVISPSGFVMFISKIFEGRTSEVTMVKDSGFLSLISPGDEVMADCRFPIAQELSELQATLNIPALTKSQSSVGEGEVVKSRQVRIHVETAIARLKSFHLLKFIYPITQKPMLDDILTICCSLCNLQNEQFHLDLQ